MVGQDDSDDDATQVSPAVGAALTELYAAARATSGGDGMQLVVADIKEEVNDLRKEFARHRDVLKQFIEVREPLLDLLAHRESLLQCLELREGMHAVLGSARVLAELGDKTAELDLSLAGVSDNTARHGKALGNLAEQQKRTAVTLDAVVRAVKRLDRSRSRSRDCMAGTLRSNDPSPAHIVVQQDNSEDMVSFSAPPTSTHAGEVEARGFGVDAEVADRGWWDAPCGVAQSAEVTSEAPLAGVAMDVEGNNTCAPGGAAGELAEDDPWHWPGWSVGRNDEPEVLQQSAEDLRVGSAPSSPCSDAAVMRPHSAASENLRGASVRSARRSGGAPHSARSSVGRGAAAACAAVAEASAARYHRRSNGTSGARGAPSRSGGPVTGEPKVNGCRGAANASGIPDPSHGGPGDLGADYGPTSPASVQSNAEMAHCVKGVLARIEEALTKLDGADGGAGRGSSRRSGSAPGTSQPTPMPTPRGPESWDPNVRRPGGYTRGQRMPSRPQSASVRRSGKPAGAGVVAPGSGSAQRRRRGADEKGGAAEWLRGDPASGSWRMVDSWA